MARSEAAISILQIDGASLTHLAAAPDDTAFRIEAYASETAGGTPSADALRAFVERAGIAVDRLFTVLPRHEVTVRILILPAREPAEIASMVALTAGEFAPYPRETLVIEHRVLEELPSGESRVLLVLAQQEAVNRHLKQLREAGLEPQQIYLSTSCLLAGAALAPPSTADRYGLVHLGHSALEVAVIDHGVLCFSRGVSHGEAWSFSDPHSRESIAYEVRDALSAFRRECDDGLGVSTLYAAADEVDFAAFAAFLEESTEKTCLAAPFLDDLVSNAEALSGSCPLACAGALLAAEGRAKGCIALLPASLARERRMRDVQRRVLRYGALAAVMLAALGCWFAQAVVQRVLLIRELRVQAEALAPSAEGVAAKQRSLQLISGQVDGEGGFLELLSAVASAAPASDFNFTRIDFDREAGLDLWGRARSKDQVLSEFLGNLRRLGEGSLSMLARAHSQYETVGRERDEAVFDYHVSIPMLPEEDGDGHAATDR